MENTYKTKDLYEAAALLAKGEKFVGIDRKARPPHDFIFEDKNVCNAISIRHLNGDLAVMSKEYAEAVKVLKVRVNDI